MLPILFHIGRYPVATHDFFLLMGVVVATFLFIHEARRRQMLNEQLIWIALGTLFMGAVFARLSTAWLYIASVAQPSIGGMWLHGGRSIVGGLAGAYLGALIVKRLVGYRERTGDLFAPAVALGMAIGRWGCFLTEQLGTPTSLPWGIRLSEGLEAQPPLCRRCGTGVAMHPSFLYEIIFHVVMFSLIWWCLRFRLQVRGEIFKIYLLCYAIFRFGVEFVRGNEMVWGGLTWTQLFLIPSGMLLAIYFVRHWVAIPYAVPIRGGRG